MTYWLRLYFGSHINILLFLASSLAINSMIFPLAFCKTCEQQTDSISDYDFHKRVVQYVHHRSRYTHTWHLISCDRMNIHVYVYMCIRSIIPYHDLVKLNKCPGHYSLIQTHWQMNQTFLTEHLHTYIDIYIYVLSDIKFR